MNTIQLFTLLLLPYLSLQQEESSRCSPPPDYFSALRTCYPEEHGDAELPAECGDVILERENILVEDKSEKDALLEKEQLEGYTDGWKQLNCKFYNSFDPPRDIRMFFEHTDQGVDDIDYGVIKPGDFKALTSYLGNKLYAVDDETRQQIDMVQVNVDQTLYHFSEKVDVRNTKEFKQERETFKREYQERTGKAWINTYPRGPATHFMYDPVEIGHVQKASSRHFFWNRGMEGFPDEDEPALEFELETLSISPKVFAVRNVMSADEADYIIELAKPKLKRSVVSTKGVVSNVRTSSNTWLPTTESAVIKNVYSRIADITKLDEKNMAHDMSAENLQIVYYNTTQQYKEHHDYLEPDVYLDSENVQRGNNRFFTFLFYLNDVEEGGHTAFPMSDNPTGRDTKFILPKGSAVLFYSMLEDGNLDIKSKHAGRPPTLGYKWIANLWVWDPRWL